MRFATPILLSCVVAALLGAATAQAELVSEHGDWAVFKEKEGGSHVCFMSSQPTKAQGKYNKRGEIFAIVSHRPQEKRINEVGFQAGYTYKKDVEASAAIDRTATFKLFTEGDSAWTYDKKSDEAMVKAMKKGTTMVVKGTSTRGTRTTDTYSLRGFTAAHGASLKACGVQ